MRASAADKRGAHRLIEAILMRGQTMLSLRQGSHSNVVLTCLHIVTEQSYTRKLDT